MALPAQETIDRYARQAVMLMPPGRAFSRRLDSTIRAILEAIAIPLARVHEDGDALLRELLPSQADALLPDWEAATGLPNCVSTPTDVPSRQAALISHLVASGGQSEADFKAIAAALGFEVDIGHEYLPMTCVDPCTSPVASIDWVWHLLVTVLDGPPALLDLLKCRLRQHAHIYAHLGFAVPFVELEQGGGFLELEQGGPLELEQA